MLEDLIKRLLKAEGIRMNEVIEDALINFCDVIDDEQDMMDEIERDEIDAAEDLED